MNKPKFLLIVLTPLFVIFLFTVSCTTTVTSNKAPEFKVEQSSIEHNLNAIVKCQQFQIKGFEKKVNSNVFTELQITITNGTNIPAGKEAINELAKKIASQVKMSLKNQNAFNNYKVSFVEETGSVVTVAKSKTMFYKSDDI
ncbi:MAG: hypothetical protein Q8928_10230 [Bacteroidota bacterium]|nr:hypothetical protein [Bacteroidota bacterium]